VEQFRLNATSTQGVVTYPIVVAVDNSDELLKPGMTAQVRIVVASKTDVVRIPTAALRFKPDEDETEGRDAAAISRFGRGQATRPRQLPPVPHLQRPPAPTTTACWPRGATACASSASTPWAPSRSRSCAR
jgi:multidrug efflux pump subunit AcrA (membrane-fusion protein)